MSFYLGSEPVPQAILRKESTTLTAGQTVISTGGYSDGDLIQVSLNGVILEGSGVDYTATNGSDITLTVAGSAGDVLQFQTFDAFELVGSKFSAPTITNDVTLKNDTEEDTDGGRSSKLVYKGEQSGGQESTLAEIQASHDGSSNDQKGDLIFRTNDGSDGSSPTEAMRIDSAGQVGIGVTNPHEYYSKELVVGGGANNGITIADTAGNSTNYVMFADGTSGNAQYRGYMEFAHSTDSLALVSYGKQRFFTSSNGSTASERWQITTDGHFKAMSNGLGIDFSATEGSGASSSVFDDYEEGTWTPYLSRWTGGSISATYTSQVGRYTKVGRLVTLSFSISTSAISSQGTSIAYIAGLPYNNDASHNYMYAGTFGLRTSISSSTVATSIIKHSTNNSLLIRQDNNFDENVDDNWLVGEMRGSITYEHG